MSLDQATITLSFYALISLMATLANTAHAIFVFLKDPRSPVNRVWALATGCLVWWGFGEVILRATDQPDVADMMNRIFGIGLRMLPAFFLHFTLVFTERQRVLRRWWAPLFIYGPALVFSGLQFTGHITHVIRLPWGYASTPADGFLYYILWLESCFLWGLYLCYEKFMTGRFRRERRQALLVLLGVVIPLLPSSLIDGLLPLLGIQMIRIAEISSTITVAFVTYAVVRFQLMSLTPESSAKAILDTIGGLLAVTDPDGRIVFTNESFKEKIGTEDHSITRFHFYDFVDEGRGVLLDAYRAAPELPSSALSEVKFRSMNGSRFPGLLSVSPILNEGETVGFAHFARDISELKRSDEALRQSEIRFRSVWENSTDGMRLTDENGIIVAVNSSFCAMAGMKESELTGRPITVTYSGKADREEMLRNYRERFERRRIEPHVERLITLHSGKTLYIEGIHSFFELEYGKGLLLGVFRDVSERKIAERRIQMLAHTITSMQECVTITDMKDNILSVNPAFLRVYGYEEAEIIGKHITIVRSPDNPPGLSEEINAQTLRGGWTGELLNVRKNGETFPIVMSSSIVRDNAGTPVAFVGIARDITEQKNLQRRLDEASRRRNEDLRRFAIEVQRAQEEERRRIARELHDDLGQRLSGMKFNIEVFEDTLENQDAPTREKLDQFKKQIDGMIIEIRRLSSNLHPSVLDDFGLIVALKLLCEEIGKIQNIKILFEPADAKMGRFEPHVEIALFRIVQEALSNVGKHAGASEVRVRLGLEGDTVRLQVRDNGSGFDTASVHLKKDSSRGLGLISMRERSEELGGTCRIESTPGKGTTITVEFPVHR
ncbi:MAG TPA: PAS domain S-box protein [Bacteroidota bacterium]|jgi:PAS domain S-box-containing protein